MSPSRRNLIVGVVVLLGLLILTWMLLLFAGRATAVFVKTGIAVTLTSDRADGLSDGSSVLYRGVVVGRITGVRRMPDNISVEIRAELDREPPLPRNLKGAIQTSSALGSAAQVQLELNGPPSPEHLRDGDKLPAGFVGLALIPESITGLASDIRQQQFVQHLNDTVLSIRQQAERAGEVLQSVQKLISDPRVQEDLRQAVANVRTATESADRIGGKFEKLTDKLDGLTDSARGTMTDVRGAIARTNDHIDELSRKLSTDIEKLGGVLEQFNAAAGKINDGKGTAGLLLNDPKLYNSLVDTARTLNATTADLQRVIEQWEQEGVPLKLGK